MSEPQPKSFLNVGGGSATIEIPPYYAGWRQVRLDIDPGCNPDVVLDARLLHTQPPATYDAVYCAHNLEHYYHHEAAGVVRGFAHVLKPDGFAEIHVPDLLWVMRDVVERKLDIDDVLYHTSTPIPILVRDVLYGYHVEIERSQNDFYAHKTGFSPASLSRLFMANGFSTYAVGVKYQYEVTGYYFKQPPTSEQFSFLQLRTA